MIHLGPTPLVTVARLREAMPGCPRAEVYAPHIEAAITEFEMRAPIVLVMALAQMAHETDDLRIWVELSDGAAYEGAARLGNTQPGDGRKFRGHGPPQLTGRRNYEAASKKFGIPLTDNPRLMLDPAIGFRVACWFWRVQAGENLGRDAKRILRPYLQREDGGLDLSVCAQALDFIATTWAYNGGQNGAADRARRLVLCAKAFGVDISGVRLI